MVILAQRVENAELSIIEQNRKKFIGDIGKGLVVYIGFSRKDTEANFEKYAEKIVNLRIFSDKQGKMNQSVADKNLGIMIIPNFTLSACTKKGNRPSFDNAMRPEPARALFNKFVEVLKTKNSKVVSGIFGADMRIGQMNHGPINIILNG